VIEQFLGFLAARITDKESRHRFLGPFRELCSRVWRLDQAKGLALLPKSRVSEMLRAMVDAQDWAFLDQATSRLGGYPPVPFFKWVADEVVAGRVAVQDVERR
jgi:hypothetical protein